MSYRYNSTYVSTRRQSWSRNQNTVAFVSSVKLGPVTNIVVIALLITILGLVYLTQATRVTGYDYATQKIDNQIAELNDQKSDLEIENARLASLETIKNSSVASNMTAPVTTEYAQ